MIGKTCLYSELGVGKTASMDEIKTAFRKLAMAHHPDRHADLSEEQKNVESDRFKRISAAYQVRFCTASSWKPLTFKNHADPRRSRPKAEV